MQQFSDLIIRNILINLDFISFLKCIRTCKKVFSQSKYILNSILNKNDFPKIKLKKKRYSVRLFFEKTFKIDISNYFLKTQVDRYLKKHDLFLKLEKGFIEFKQLTAPGPCRIYKFSMWTKDFTTQNLKNKINSLHLLQFICEKMEGIHPYGNCLYLEIFFKENEVEYARGDKFKYFLPTKDSKWDQLIIGNNYEFEGIIFSICEIFEQKCFSSNCENHSMHIDVLRYFKKNFPEKLLNSKHFPYYHQKRIINDFKCYYCGEVKFSHECPLVPGIENLEPVAFFDEGAKIYLYLKSGFLFYCEDLEDENKSQVIIGKLDASHKKVPLTEEDRNLVLRLGYVVRF